MMQKKLILTLTFLSNLALAQNQALPPLKCESNDPEVQAKLNYLYTKIKENYGKEDIKLEATNFVYEFQKSCMNNQSLQEKMDWEQFKKSLINVKIKKQIKTRNKKSQSDFTERSLPLSLTSKENCSDTLNLTGPLSFENTKNQGSMGWCYAYSASDLVAHKLGRAVSPLYLAVSYNKEVGRTLENKPNSLQSKLEGGYSKEAIHSALYHGGFCSEEDLPSRDNLLTQYTGMNPFSKLFVHLNGDNQLISFYLKNLEKMSSKYKNKSFSNSDYAKLEKKYGSSFPNLKTSEIASIIQTSKPHEVIEKLFEANCKGKLLNSEKTNLENLVVAHLNNTTETTETLKARVNNVLSNKNVVSIAFSARILQNKSDTSGKDHHEVLLVGRKFDQKKNQCLYLVRNSYGSDCKTYDSSYECKNGHIWVPEETLFRSVDIVTYFK